MSELSRAAARKNVACDECKRRKVRCSAEPNCSNCVRDEKKCNYSSPLQRVSVLERKVRAYEELVQSIRRAWAVYVPDVPLQGALENKNGAPLSKDTTPPTAESQAASTDHGPPRTSETIAQEQDDHDLNNPEDFEFDESQETDGSLDGMGFLTLNPVRAGYTGPQAGIAALRLLRSLPSTYPIDEGDEHTYPSLHSLQQSASVRSTATLVDDYFQHFHPTYPMLHEGTFRARVSGALAKPKDGSWPLLYNMVLAIGAFAGDTEDSNLDIKYYRTAKELTSLDVVEKGSLTYVQGLTLMADYLQKRNKPNAGFVIVGIAWSMAMAIGLHREFGFKTTPFAMEIRRRTWWSLFLFVSGAQLTLGRPPASLVGINLRAPLNVDDSSLAVDMECLPTSLDGPTIASCLIAQIPLAKIANEVQTELLNNHVPNAIVAERLDQEIETWRAGLPLHFSQDQVLPWEIELPKLVLLWRSYHLQVVLNRPFLFQAISQNLDISTGGAQVLKCLAVADSCVDSIHRSMQSGLPCKRLFGWYATYWLISSSFVHAICFTYAPQSALAHDWSLRMQRALDVLAGLGFAHNMADRARRILQRIHGEFGFKVVIEVLRLINFVSVDRFAASPPTQQTQSREVAEYMNNNFGVAHQHQDIAIQNNSMEWISLQNHLQKPLDLSGGSEVTWDWPQTASDDLTDAVGGTLWQDYRSDLNLL